MGNWSDGVMSDFSDLPSVAAILRIAVRLVVAAVLGGAVGFERNWAGKSAGLRTHMLVCLGSALVVVVPQQAGFASSDLSRVIQGIVSGIGFIGAGAILKRTDQEEVKGLTTAAGLWLTAAIGIAVGLGREASAILGTVLALLILSVAGRVSAWLDRDRESMD
ncbi:MAG: MgtC/SapB family protein [Bryobacteraceae bacterium]